LTQTDRASAFDRIGHTVSILGGVTKTVASRSRRYGLDMVDPVASYLPCWRMLDGEVPRHLGALVIRSLKLQSHVRP